MPVMHLARGPRCERKTRGGEVRCPLSEWCISWSLQTLIDHCKYLYVRERHDGLNKTARGDDYWKLGSVAQTQERLFDWLLQRHERRLCFLLVSKTHHGWVRLQFFRPFGSLNVIEAVWYSWNGYSWKVPSYRCRQKCSSHTQVSLIYLTNMRAASQWHQ